MKTQMDILKTWMQARCKTERGASLVEYALLVALIAIAAIVAIQFLSREATQTFSDVGTELRDTPRGPGTGGDG